MTKHATPVAIEEHGSGLANLVDITRSKTAVKRLIAAGLLRPMTAEDREKIEGRQYLTYESGGSMGSADYLLRNVDEGRYTVYVIPSGFSAGDVHNAITAMYERERREHSADVRNRILDTYETEENDGT